MTVFIQAPWDLIQATTMLPNPDLGDIRQKQCHVNIRNAIDGTFYSYVKSNKVYFNNGSGIQVLDKYKLAWDFKLRRGKADELQAFVEAYYAVKWRITDWKDRVYRVNLTNDPLDFTCITGTGLYVVRLEFEGERLVRESNLDGDEQ